MTINSQLDFREREHLHNVAYDQLKIKYEKLLTLVKDMAMENINASDHILTIRFICHYKPKAYLLLKEIGEL